MELPTEPVNRTILLLDIESFSDRGNHQQVILRHRLRTVVEDLLIAAGAGPDQRYCEDRGDGLIVLVSGDIPKTTLLRHLLKRVPDVLGADNRAAADGAPMRLRMVLAAGEVLPDRHSGTVGGVVGQDLNETFRLLDAPVLREALRQSDTDSVLCVSRSVYEGVVHHRYQGLSPEEFHRFVATVKRDRVEGWLHGPLPHAAAAVPDAVGPATRPRPADAPGTRLASAVGDTRRRPSRRTYLTAGITAGVLAIAIGWVLTLYAPHTVAAQKMASRPRPTTSFTFSPSALPAASPSPAGSAPAGTFPSVPTGLGPSADGRTVYQEQFANRSLWTDDGHFTGASYSVNSYLVYNEPSAVRTYRIGLPDNVPQLYPQAPENVSIDVWARLDGDATVGYGAVCRARADGSGYYFTVWGTSAYIERRSPGAQGGSTLLKVVQKPSVIKSSGGNHFQVSCVDTTQGSVQLAFRVNGAVVAVALDTGGSVIRNGTIALAAGANESTKKGTAEFSHIVVGQF